MKRKVQTMSKRVFIYGERMTIPGTFVRDEITEQPKKRDTKLEAKLAKVVELLEKLVAEDRPAVDVMAVKKQQRHENARRLRDTDSLAFLQDAIRQAAYEAACEGSQAAYAARNPHKAKQKDTAQDTRLQYPHKPRQREPWEDRLATMDSRFLIICQESEDAYAARNPHKKGVKR